MFIDDLLAANAEWATERGARDSEFFPKLRSGQAPSALWIGCADSRVSPEQITGAEPGTLFVHRNVANVVQACDLNLMSVLTYAVSALKVEHIIVCGHECCGGVQAVVNGLPGGILGHWLTPIADVARDHSEVLAALPDDDARVDRLVDLNVREQVGQLACSPPVREAWKDGRSLQIHGLVFQLGTGRLERLDCTVTGTD